jgi:hypothetical protein
VIIFEIPSPPSLFKVAIVLLANVAAFLAVTYALIYGVKKAKEQSYSIPKNDYFRPFTFAFLALFVFPVRRFITYPKRVYLWLFTLFFAALFIFPIRQYITYKRHFEIWEKYQAGNYIEFNGVLNSINPGTVSMRITLDQNNFFYAYVTPDYCFNFSKDRFSYYFLKYRFGFDQYKNVYIRYIPLGESADTSYCVVYAEQDV